MRVRALLLAAALLAAAAHAAGPAEERFREANELVRAGDYPRAIALYGEVARSGSESATLYWNWAQAATARGAHGEALWALLRARELDPSDRAVVRDVERLRGALNLDPAEIAPEPLAVAGRFSRRFRLDLVAVVRRGAPLFDAASPSANTAGTLREGEVVPVLDVSGDWLQVEDNAGARGWAHEADVRRLDVAPATSSQG